MMLDNQQHELFCQKIAEGMNQTDAYEAAGYKGSRKSLQDNAARLIGNDRIQTRIAELRQTAAAKAEIDLQWLINKGVAILEAAEKEGAYAPAVSALKEVGILTGFRVEQRRNENINRTVDDLSDDDLAEYLARDGSGGTAEAPKGTAQLN